MNRFSFAAITSLLLCSTGVKASLGIQNEARPYALLRNEILKNFPAARSIQEVKKNKKGIAFPSAGLSPYEMHDVLLQFLNEDESLDTNAPCLDAKSITDLNLFFYNIDRPDYTILETTYRGFSLNGKMAQGKWMVAPITDKTELAKRQDLTRYLMERPALNQKLATLLKELAATEKDLYRFWNKNDLIYSKFVQETFYKGKQNSYKGQYGKLWLEINRRLHDLGPILTLAQLELFAAALTQIIAPYAYHKVADIPFSQAYRALRDGNGRDFEGIGPWKPLAYTSLKSLASLPTVISGQKKLSRTEAGLMFAGIGIIIPTLAKIPAWHRSLKMYQAFTTYLRGRFAVFLRWQRILKSIHEAIKEEQFLRENLEGFDDLSLFINGENPELRKFFDLISSSTFSSTSYYFANVGKVLQAVPHFLRVRDHFRPLFRAVGTLEAHFSLSTFMEEKASSPAPWCFPTYKQAAAPYIRFIDYSHPLIPADNSVLNTLTLGENGQQGMVVTGPNASGKSMNIRSIILNITLGQSLGIAPSRVAIFTPMAKILTYLNPVDNIAEGRSLFQAEEDRISYIVQTVDSLPVDQFAFIAADELLSSTAPTEGEAATFGICFGFSKYPNCMPVIATHFVKLTALPFHTNGFYANYHVSVIKLPSGFFTHPFKLEPGRAHQVIAIDLARQQGFDKEILDTADEFLREQGVERGRLI